jgi:signal transduction histidine kinase
LSRCEIFPKNTRKRIFAEDETIYFGNARKTLDESMREMRRISHHLMPDALTRFGLKPAVDDFCRTMPSQIVFDWFGEETRFDTKLEALVYRSIHELVNNAVKYADASQIMVQIMQEPDRIAFTVQDDGCGFDPETVTRAWDCKTSAPVWLLSAVRFR